MYSSLSANHISEIRNCLSDAHIVPQAGARSYACSSSSSSSSSSSARVVPLSFNIDNRKINFLSSTTEVHHHNSTSSSSEKSKKDQDRHNALIGLALTALGIGATFFAGRAFASFVEVRDCREKIGTLRNISCATQAFHLQNMDIDLAKIQNNRLWTICNRVCIAVGLVFLGLGFLLSSPVATGAGGTLLLVGALLEASRLGVNWSLEKKRADSIEHALDELTAHRQCDTSCHRLPPSYYQAMGNNSGPSAPPETNPYYSSEYPQVNKSSSYHQAV